METIPKAKEIYKVNGNCVNEVLLEGCDFLRVKRYEVGFARDPNKGYETVTMHKPVRFCELFNNVQMGNSSLFICNKIYGLDYEGDP